MSPATVLAAAGTSAALLTGLGFVRSAGWVMFAANVLVLFMAWRAKWGRG